ncbi:winged helix-turn-helix transcriptional regulator [Pseudomonas sp. NY15435]|uniref:winged helix-turn-helix transcriptional regulator n=1 Tax=Pseudomonas sp. NY15435 TaxID=3400358 RepID=UPI003A8804E7
MWCGGFRRSGLRPRSGGKADAWQRNAYTADGACASVRKASSTAGSKRFNELRRDMPEISQRVLTAELRALEEAGLIVRTVHPEVPPRVEYCLSVDGERLRPVVDAVKTLGLWLKARAER